MTSVVTVGAELPSCVTASLSIRGSSDVASPKLSPDHGSCHCSLWQAPCTRAITEEDLLCDECREGDCTQWHAVSRQLMSVAELRTLIAEARELDRIESAEGPLTDTPLSRE